MGDESKQPERKPDLMEFGSDIMRKMDDFFYSKPSRNIMDSIDEFFKQQAPFSTLPVDMYENDKEWVVKVDLPGVNKEDIKLDVAGDRVKIRVANDQEIEQHDDNTDYYRRERRYYQTERTVQLPYPVDRKKAKASYKNGVLTLRGPKQSQNHYRLDIE